ncbi:TNF receptor-associated factor 1 [Exaiptasia diaphana]|nr:TNF receptor-associated factor 1 [Exaiptasia diaphana]
MRDLKGPRRSLSDHYKNNLADHLTITTQQLLTLRGEVLELKASSIALMTKDDQSHYSYTWKINDFSKQLYSLQSSKTVTSNCTANRSTLTIFMIIMRGEYDAILTWPFNWKNKFILLDQKPYHSMRKNIDDGYSIPDTSNCSYQRPTTNESVGIGRPEFVSHGTLKTENYVVDGAVFIKFELDSSVPN